MTRPTVQRILFPTDFSACAEGAYRHAVWLADRFEAELHVLHVVEGELAPARDWPEAPDTGLVRISLADVCRDLGLPLPPPAEDYDPSDWVEVVEAEIVGLKAPDGILDYVHGHEIDIVVMGTHGHQGWRRGVLGTVAEAVARRAPCPVLTVRSSDAPGDGAWPPSRVLLAVDDVIGVGTLPAAARWAAQLAVAYHAPLEVVHVTVPAVVNLGGPGMWETESRRAHKALASLTVSLRDDLDAEFPVIITTRIGDPTEVVRAVAEETGTHLLVVGTHGRSGPARALLGSVAEDLMRTAPCPVLVARDALTVRDKPTVRSPLKVAQ